MKSHCFISNCAISSVSIEIETDGSLMRFLRRRVVIAIIFQALMNFVGLAFFLSKGAVQQILKKGCRDVNTNSLCGT